MGSFTNNGFDLGVDENNGVSGLIRQRRNHLMAIWLGLFAMLMIHVGPLISGAQALLLVETVFTEAVADSVVTHDHAAMLTHADVQSSGVPTEHAEHAVDYHALMGHQKAPDGAPQWLANLEMCGYCDLLTLSPPLVLALLLALPIVPAVQWLTVLPALPRPLAAAHSLRHPRAPPVHLFA